MNWVIICFRGFGFGLLFSPDLVERVGFGLFFFSRIWLIFSE